MARLNLIKYLHFSERHWPERLVAYLPFLKNFKLNFISIHWLYVTLITIICSIIIFPSKNVSYINALYLAAGATTQTGLNPVDIASLHTYQQLILALTAIITSPMWINTTTVFVRLFMFERRFHNIVEEAKAMRRLRTKGSTASRHGSRRDDEERGIGISALKERVSFHIPGTNAYNKRQAKARAATMETTAPAAPENRERDEAKQEEASPNAEYEEPATGASSMTRIGDSEATTPQSKITDEDESDFGPGMSDDEDLRGFRIPARLTPEQHLAFLKSQRGESSNTDLRGLAVNARQRANNGTITEKDEPRPSTEVERKSDETATPADAAPEGENGPPSLRPASSNRSTHIRINAPAAGPSHPRLNQTVSRRSENDQESSSHFDAGLVRPIRRITTTLRDFATNNSTTRDGDLPYLSWQPTIGRNSAFADLTEEQREELGGIEYRSLKTLGLILILYLCCFYVLGFICLLPWIMRSAKYGGIVNKAGGGRPWWALFTAISAFNDVGYTLTPDSMNEFNDAVFPLLVIGFLIVVGNVGFPIMLRFMIWCLSLFPAEDSPLYEELQFLLDHPRRCFTLLFPSQATWWLFFVLILLNAIDVILFVVLDLHVSDVTSLSSGIRFLDGLFQAIATRTAGFTVVSLSDLHPAVQISYMVMMYISVLPIAISMRRTNVYEERSLGISYDEVKEEQVQSMTANAEDGSEPRDPSKASYVKAHLRRQLSFDLWYLFLGLFVIAIAESSRLDNKKQYDFNLFSVLFEVVSAYGTVGLTLGYPTINSAFSSEFTVVSKLVMIAMELRGRHRGLPYDLDRAILLPSEKLNRTEQIDAENRLRRTATLMSSHPTMNSTATRYVDPTAYGRGRGDRSSAPQSPISRTFPIRFFRPERPANPPPTDKGDEAASQPDDQRSIAFSRQWTFGSSHNRAGNNDNS